MSKTRLQHTIILPIKTTWQTSNGVQSLITDLSPRYSANQGYGTPWQFKACFIRVTVNFWLFMDRLFRLQLSGLLLSWKKFFGYHTEPSKNFQLFLQDKQLLSKPNSSNPPLFFPSSCTFLYRNWIRSLSLYLHTYHIKTIAFVSIP